MGGGGVERERGRPDREKCVRESGRWKICEGEAGIKRGRGREVESGRNKIGGGGREWE